MKKESLEEKSMRVLSIYSRLYDGEVINKRQECERYGVSERTIQRDISIIQCHLEEQGTSGKKVQEIIYDRNRKGYRMESRYAEQLNAKEILVIGKILVESRALMKTEMVPAINKMLDLCIDDNDKKLVKEMLSNELEHYVELQHKEFLLDKMWDMGLAIKNHQFIKIQYRKLKNSQQICRKLRPVGIMFSEYYFYLVGFVEANDPKYSNGPAIYRMDRIQQYEILDEHFAVVYKNRFEEGEFRKRIPFMYGGPLNTVTFLYKGPDINAVLDRLPTATYRELDEENYLVKAEVYGKTGIEMWLRSQGDYVTYVE